MGPLLRQPAGQNRGNLRGDRNRLGLRSEVALNQGFRANSGARSSKPGPAMRLNWVLLPREPGSASFYGVFEQAPLRISPRGPPIRARTGAPETTAALLLGGLWRRGSRRGGSSRLTVAGRRQF